MGILFFLASAFVLGTAVSWPLGLGRMGAGWHVGIGAAGIALSWAFMIFLPLPDLIRIAINGIAVYPVWSSVATLMVGTIVALARGD
jgi:hypothetical protein